jgi:hypothetical protein
MALLWWGVEIPSQCDQHSAEFIMAVHDLDWVMAELIKEVSTGEKCAMETDSEEQHPVKR